MANTVAAPLFFSRGLYLTGTLYVAWALTDNNSNKETH